MSYPRALHWLALLAGLTACTEQPTAPPTPVDPAPAPVPVGVYEFTLTGIGGPTPTSTVSAAPVADGPARLTLTPVGAGISLEQISSGSYTEGVRGQRAHRYLTFTYRVRNSTGAPLTNLTMVPVIRSSTVPGTPFSVVRLFDGTNAPPAVATTIVPTGATALGEDGKMRSLYPDVLQVFTEAEVAAIAIPAGATGIFPYGFVVRNPNTPGSRTIPVASGPNDFGGMLTVSLRVPLQAAGATSDVFTITVQMLGVQDSETRMTESIEESRDTAAVRRLHERAAALGATTVTVLPGSPARSPYVADFPGQRGICTVRTAGTAAVPVTYITAPAAYTALTVYRPGEALDPCEAFFTSGTPAPAHYGMPYAFTMRSMDRYGNVNPLTPDTITLSSSDGTATLPAAAGLAAGLVTRVSSYTTFGNSTLFARGRRLVGLTPVSVTGMTRTWTGNVDNNWGTHGDWAQNMTTGVQDSVIIPGDRPNYPLLVQNQTIAAITMTDGAAVQPSIHVGSFDLTVNGSLALGNGGQILGTGRVLLNGGPGSTLGGGLSNFDVRNLRINGFYSTTSNVNVTGGRIVVQGGRLRSAGVRIRVRPS